MKQRLFITALALVILLIGPAVMAGVGFGDFNSGAPAQSADIHLVGRSCTINGSPGYCTRQETNGDLNSYVQAHAPGTSGQILFNSGGNLTTDTAANIRTKLGLGSASIKAASGSGGTVASVSGATTSGHVCTFADSTGTVQDGGAAPDLTAYVPKTTTVNGHALSGNISVTASDLSLGNVTNVAQLPLSYLDTDTALAANSDVKVGSQKAVKAYIDSHTGAALSGLSDVNLGTLADKDLLKYDNASGKWKNGTVVWGEVTGKPSFATVATSGAYSDLSGTPDLSAYVPTTRTVNGHALSGNISVTATDLSLGSVENTALSTWAGSSSITTLGAIAGADNITFAAGKALRTGTSDTNTFKLQAYDVDGTAYTTFATLTAGNTPTFDLAAATTIGGNAIVDATRTVAGHALSSNVSIACGDLSNAAASCATDATNATNISSGTLAAGRLPNPSATTLGGIESIASASHNFLTSISTSGVPAKAQPACGDLSDAAASCSTDATNASNISAGTLAAGRLPNPSASTLGGVESLAAVSHKWINTISTSGVPAATQPACADISDSVASCSTDATNASNISSGTLAIARGGTNAGSTAAALANLGAAPAVLAIDTQTASYTLVLGDALGSSGAGGAVLMNVGSANNLTVPPHSSVAWLVGTQVIVCQKGAGQTTIVAGAGVTINTGAATKKLRVQYSCVTLFEDAQDDWYLSGDLAAS